MNRGQASLELMVILIVAAIAITVFGFQIQTALDSQKMLQAQNQAKTIAFSLSKNLAGLAILQQTDSGNTVLIPTQKIKIMNPTYKEKCTIQIRNNGAGSDSTASVNLDWANDGINPADGDITITKKTIIPDGFSIPASAECGNPISIQKN